MLSGRGLCDELITRPEESYRPWCVVVCDIETSRIGAPYIYDISNLRVNLLRLFLSVDIIASLVSFGLNINTNITVLEKTALFDNRYSIGLLYYVHQHAETATKKSSYNFQHVKIYNVNKF